MFEILIGIACLSAGYFTELTVKGKMRLKSFFLTMLTISILLCVGLEWGCFRSGTCAPLTVKTIMIEVGGSFALAGVFALLLFGARKYKKRAKVMN